MLTANCFKKINSQPILRGMKKEKDAAVLVAPTKLKCKKSKGHNPSEGLLRSILVTIPKDRKVFIADIRNSSNLSKSSVDVALRYLFANGYIEKYQLPHNGRYKSLFTKIKDVD